MRTFVFSVSLFLSILLCGVSADAQQKAVGSKQKRKHQQQRQQQQQQQQQQIEQVAGGMAQRLNRELPWQLRILSKMLAAQGPREIPDIPPYQATVASASAANKDLEQPGNDRTEIRQTPKETLPSEANVATVMPVNNDLQRPVNKRTEIRQMSNETVPLENNVATVRPVKNDHEQPGINRAEFKQPISETPQDASVATVLPAKPTINDVHQPAVNRSEIKQDPKETTQIEASVASVIPVKNDPQESGVNRTDVKQLPNLIVDLTPAEGEGQPDGVPVQDPGERPKLRLPDEKPLGAAGPSRDKRKPTVEDADFQILQDRWRVGLPQDPRFTKGNIFNPYRQNVLKGDYPLFGNDIFLNVNLALESVYESKRIPVPQGLSANNPGSFEFFGRGRLDTLTGNVIMSFDLFKGDASFKPVDWRVKVTGIANFNYLAARENEVVNLDGRENTTRNKNFTSVEELFFEYRLGDTQKIFPFLRGRGSKGGRSAEYDTTSIRAGIQQFSSDFRGFIFSDSNLGARLFGNFGSNRYQYNLASFSLLEKETNSQLNTINFRELQFRNQQVYIANLFRQDTFVLGYTTQFSLHYSDDKPTLFVDRNNLQVRPARIGRVTPHRVRSGYFGWTGDGHFGRLNVSHALYQVIGSDTFNQIAQQATRINAQMGAMELSLDYDYIRYRVSAFYTSGDSNPYDNRARGFDAIQDAPNFAGGQFSFFNSQGIRLNNTAVALVEPKSLIPSLRSSKIQGQANFVNPGVSIYNAALDFDITPKLRGFANYNYIRFNKTQVLEAVLFQPGIRKEVGHDVGIGFIYRPLLNENIIFTGGTSTLISGRGFTDIFTSNCDGTPRGCGASRPTLYNAFIKMKLMY